jgi:MFS family permease
VVRRRRVRRCAALRQGTAIRPGPARPWRQAGCPVALALVVAGLSAASMVLFVVGTVVGGVGVGGAFLGSLSTANRLAPPAQRGRVLSTYFVFCYIGQAIPVIGVGFASADVGDFRAVLVCAIVLAAVSVMSMVGIRRAALTR